MKKSIITLLSFLMVLTMAAQDKPEGLFINSKAPDFKLNDQDGKEVSLKELRKKGNVVVVFYRGSWCPYCSRYVKRLQDSLDLIKAKGAQVVVITPQGAEGIDSAVNRTGASFPILHDKDMKMAKGYKVAYKVDEKTVARYKNANPSIDLLKTNEQTKEAYLPVPAVYVVNTDGSVVFRYFEEDYKKRLTVKDLLSVL
ncbi:MAG TPA: peroxiredoxin-like family protein [Flavisolibacter sp.]|nr:peroxiredoxin-like family protein [Flavisolibacter sp.]